MEEPQVFMHILLGGIMPKRQTAGAIGYDVHIRAIVSPSEADQDNPRLRKTLFDFKRIPDDPVAAAHVVKQL